MSKGVSIFPSSATLCICTSWCRRDAVVLRMPCEKQHRDGRVNRLWHWEYSSTGISTDITLVSWISNKIRIQGKMMLFYIPCDLESSKSKYRQLIIWHAASKHSREQGSAVPVRVTLEQH